IRLTPAATLPWALLPNTPDTQRKRENSSRPPRNSGAKRTKTCRSFDAFKREFLRGAEWSYCLPNDKPSYAKTSYEVRFAYCGGPFQVIFSPGTLRRPIGVLYVSRLGGKRR